VTRQSLTILFELQLRAAIHLIFIFSSWDSFVPFISERAKPRCLGIFDAPHTATDSMFLINCRSRRWAGRLPRVILERYFAPVFPRRQLQFAADNPLPAIARWGVVQLVGHLTVNEDGEGSNPSAPAKFFKKCWYCALGQF
jgi:hypothetical protein